MPKSSPRRRSVGRPRLAEDEATFRISLNVPAPLMAALRRLAARHNESLNEAVRALLYRGCIVEPQE